MNLNAITFENYKAFATRQSLGVRPLTVLIGKNSSGKSVISRLPLLLGRSLSEQAISPMELAFEGLDFGSSTIDLIHNRIPHGAVSVGAEVAVPGNTPIGFSMNTSFSLFLVSSFKAPETNRSH
jgi:hypothetical protein